MHWESRSKLLWNIAYAAAVRYYEEHKNLAVSVTYVTPDGIALGKWAARQQYARKNPRKSNSKLSEKRIALLDAIEFPWGKDDPWENRYALTEEYYQAHGHLQIPAKYVTEDDIWLGRWMYEQRCLLRQDSPKLSKLQKERLQSLLDKAVSDRAS